MTSELLCLEDKEKMFSMCKDAQNDAYGKIKVGAVCSAINYKTKHRHYFTGANLHVSDSFSDIHAEQLAVNLALLERYYPTEIYVTSQSFDEDVTMCGSCRHYISEINQNCSIIVFNPDGTQKSINLLSDVYPNAKNTVKKNNKFKMLCGWSGVVA